MIFPHTLLPGIFDYNNNDLIIMIMLTHNNKLIIKPITKLIFSHNNNNKDKTPSVDIFVPYNYLIFQISL
jgi:hypothetical protein